MASKKTAPPSKRFRRRRAPKAKAKPIEPVAVLALPPRQEMFVLEYLKDFNATNAAIRAGYSKKTAHVQGPRLLGNVAVAKFLAAAMDERKERVKIDTDRLEQEAERIAVSDIRKLVKDGMLLRLEDIPDELAPAISSIEVVTKQLGEGEIERIAKIRFWDKPSTIKLLFQVRGHGHLNDKNVNLAGEMTVTTKKAETDAIARQKPKELLEAEVALGREFQKRLEAVREKFAEGGA